MIMNIIKTNAFFFRITPSDELCTIRHNYSEQGSFDR